MAKKAFLVGFSTLTRVIVDVEDETLENDMDHAKVIYAARTQMMENSIADYINGETCDRIDLDEEMPYNPEDDD